MLIPIQFQRLRLITWIYNKELEVIVGLQTDEPLKRAIMPFGGIRMVIKGAEAYGHSVDLRLLKYSQSTERLITREFMMYILPK